MTKTVHDHRDDSSVAAEPLRVGLAACLTAAAGAHLPVLAEHLHEAMWLGWLFVAFIAVSLTFGTLVITRHAGWVAPVAALLLASALGFYVATRSVAFPQIADDVGDWFDPWGVASVVAETVGLLVAIALWARQRSLAIDSRAIES